MVVTDPMQVYGMYLHPSGDEAVLQADSLNKLYYTNKGFAFLCYVEAPGVSPAPASAPETAEGRREAANERKEAEQHMRQVLRERGVPDQVPGVEGSNHDRIVNLAVGKMVAVPTKDHWDATTETLPGELVAKGVTRGIPGLDVTMPSPVPGVAITNQTHQRDAVLRGEVEHVEQEIDTDAGKVTVKLPRAVSREERARRAAAKRPQAEPSTPAAPEPSNSGSPTRRR